MSDSDVFNLEGGVQAEEGVDAGHLSGFTPSVPSEVRLIGIFILLCAFVPVSMKIQIRQFDLLVFVVKRLISLFVRSIWILDHHPSFLEDKQIFLNNFKIDMIHSYLQSKLPKSNFCCT